MALVHICERLLPAFGRAAHICELVPYGEYGTRFRMPYLLLMFALTKTVFSLLFKYFLFLIGNRNDAVLTADLDCALECAI